MIEDFIPHLAYRYKPTEDYLYSGEKHSIKRSIFYKTQVTVFEKNAIQEFKFYLVHKTTLKSIPSFYTDEELLRTLIRYKFSCRQAAKGFLSEVEWRSSVLPNSYHSLGSQVQVILGAGIVYISGRDNRFRPMIVVNTGKLAEYKRFSEKIIYLLVFFVEFFRVKLTVPGKVENFILLVDFCGKRVKEAPVEELKKIYDVIQTHYPGFLSLNYIVNCQKTSFLDTFFYRFFDAETKKKTIWDDQNGKNFILTHFNESQVEKKYGGALDDFYDFWPVTMPKGNFCAAGESPDRYLIPDEMSENEFVSINENIHISLPFSADIINETDSFKLDLNSFKDRLEVPAATDYFKQRTQVAEKPAKTTKKICCKKCLIF